MEKSKIVKSLKKKLFVTRTIDFLVLIVPLIIYFIIGITSGGIVNHKVTLISLYMVALILTCFNIIWQKHLRSPLWICIVGAYIAIDKILPLLIILTICSMLDEIILSPAIKNLKNKIAINKEIDKRL